MGMSSLTGGGGLSASSAARSGDAKGLSGSGSKTFNFGSNPNIASSQVVSTLTSPLFIGAILVGLFIYTRRK